MAFKDILVHLDPGPRSDVRLGIAADLAARFGAHLVGLHIIELPPPDVFAGFPVGAFAVERGDEVMDQMRGTRRSWSEVIEQRFRDRLRRDGLAGEWRAVEGEASELLTLHARYADLVVVGQPEPDSKRLGPSVDALMAAGRPLLMVPFAGDFPTVGETALVGWNGTREATRAVHDALPLLAQAKRVVVLAINPTRGINGHGDVPAADMALHLARHGIRAEAAHTVAADIPEGDALLSYAADIGADLLVCGMYGHSRLRELAFGGVTRSLLTEMTAPVLLSH
jgi:nucleotide-binding universal stress UspA family protein